MSHLDHIVKFKQDLIAQGVTNPVKQIEAVRTSYVKALITVNQAHKLTEDQCVDFNRFVLGYWNETTPVAGHMVMTQVGQFFRNLHKAICTAFTNSTVEIEVTPKIEGVDEKYTELGSYKMLVETLIEEANHKLAQYLETETIA